MRFYMAKRLSAKTTLLAGFTVRLARALSLLFARSSEILIGCEMGQLVDLPNRQLPKQGSSAW
jgi:hypothetical protein